MRRKWVQLLSFNAGLKKKTGASQLGFDTASTNRQPASPKALLILPYLEASLCLPCLSPMAHRWTWTPSIQLCCQSQIWFVKCCQWMPAYPCYLLSRQVSLAAVPFGQSKKVAGHSLKLQSPGIHRQDPAGSWGLCHLLSTIAVYRWCDRPARILWTDRKLIVCSHSISLAKCSLPL